MYMYMCRYICNVYICIYRYMNIYIHIYICICRYMMSRSSNIKAFTCLCRYMNIYIHMHIYMYGYVNMYINYIWCRDHQTLKHLHVYVDTYVCIYIYVDSAFTCIKDIYVCIFICWFWKCRFTCIHTTYISTYSCICINIWWSWFHISIHTYVLLVHHRKLSSRGDLLTIVPWHVRSTMIWQLAGALLQKRPMFYRSVDDSVLIRSTLCGQESWSDHHLQNVVSFIGLFCKRDL